MPSIGSIVLVRAPLLALTATGLDTPLGALALRLASPDLAAGLARGDAGAPAAVARYTARARFRPTPHGLLAGVGTGRLGAHTAIAMAEPAAHTTVGYAALSALARRLLEDDEARARVKLRVAPSLLRHGDHVMWLGPNGEALEAEIDEIIAAALVTAPRWTPWSKLARALGDDDLILNLVDDGLLLTDLVPPLIGRPPLEAMRARLARLPGTAAARARAELDAPAETDLHATLLFPAAKVTVARTSVERAARLVPTLVRLAAALVPPPAERELDPRIGAAARAAAECFGPGRLDLGAFALGGYGVRPDELEPEPRAVAPPTELLTLLVDRFANGGPARFTSAELDALLPPTDLPATFEVMLTPRSVEEDWLLGWHAPAGATLGRFAHALPAVAEALAALARCEPPGALDVSYAPDPALGDLAAHPPIRAAALALSSWPDGPARTPAQLGLLAPPPLALDGGTPAPLARLRSTTAPPGIYQLLTGWSLYRQHAPWALVPGWLARLAHVPRIIIDGFVVAPASWRVPDDSDLARWRRRVGAPRYVQVGHEDELLPIDLDAPQTTLAGHERCYEIWPPLDEAPADTSGRRVEIVALVVDAEEAPVPTAARVPPPSEVSAEAHWHTFKLFGPPSRQDRLLVEAVGPAVTAALTRGEIESWFFLRYIEGARDQVRLRVRGNGHRFERRLRAALAPAIAAGDLATIEQADYHPEHARYGAALTAVHEVFQLSSALALALLVEPIEPELRVVATLDALATGLGESRPERYARASALRAAYEPMPDELASDFRRLGPLLRTALHAPPDVLVTFVRALRRQRRARPALPALLHLAINRLAGVGTDAEARAIYFWQRTLEGLLASDVRGKPGTSTPRRRS